MDGALGALGMIVFIIGLAIFVCRGTAQATNSIKRTSKAIGKWNDEKLGKP